MPTRHYTMTAEPPEALATLRATSLTLGWTPDPAASDHTLLVLKRGANEHTFGWSADIRVTGSDDGVTTLVAATTDMPHEKDFREAHHDLDALFEAAGARHI